MDDVAGAARHFDEAIARLTRLDVARFVAAVRIHQGHLDLALARAARAKGNDEAARAHRARAEERLRAASAVPMSTDEVRSAVRLLRTALARRGSRLAPAPEGTLTIHRDARWFRLPGGRIVDLKKKKNLRLVLRALVSRRTSSPGVPLSAETILGEAWPGERILYEAGMNRVRVAMATLRSLGLRGVLTRREDGYLLDPTMAVVEDSGS
jgi:hypothetical protein